MRLFLVKFQKGIIEPNLPQKGWKADESYPVHDVWKYSTKDKETNLYHTVTKFLVCNPITGEMRWIDAKGLLYVSE